MVLLKHFNISSLIYVGLSDSSPQDSPTHVVVGRLSDHDYISIKSRESPAPRNIVINIENLGNRSTPNQYTIHKGIHSNSLPGNNMVMQNGAAAAAQHCTSNTYPMANGDHSNSEILENIPLDSDNESEYNSLEPRASAV